MQDPAANEKAAAQAEAQAAEREKRTAMMSQILSQDARERLNRITLVKPQKATAIEELLIRMAQTGQIRNKVSEDELISVLDQVERLESGASAPEKGKITFSRKKAAFDSDDEFDL